MFRQLPRLPALVLLLAVVLTGCSKVKWVGTKNNAERTWYSTGEFAGSTLRGKVLAVGGVILRDRAALDEFCAIDVARRDLTYEVQNQLWAPTLNAAIGRLAPDVEVRLWPHAMGRVVPEALEATYETYAVGALLQPRILRAWADSLPGVDYLALARIDATWLDGTGQSDWSLVEGLGRVVVATLDIYDLATQQSVWSHAEQKHVVGGRLTAPGENADSADRTRPDWKGVDRLGSARLAGGRHGACPPSRRPVATASNSGSRSWFA